MTLITPSLLNKEGLFIYTVSMDTILDYVARIVEPEERQGSAVLATQEYICSVLERYKIPYILNSFSAEVPRTRTAFLEADGVMIPCKGCGLMSGEFEKQSPVISSPTPVDVIIEEPLIAFNPECEVISRGEYFFAPALAIARKDAERVKNASSVHGKVEVERKQYEFSHILVGNMENPRAVVFAHYDSLAKGAFDNASGSATVLHAIVNNPSLLSSTLFVFDPCEELSFEKPTYWGYGFRVFEEKYYPLLQGAEMIIPVDGVGNGPVHHDTNSEILHLAFPLKNSKALGPKISTLYADIGALPSIYHSPADTIENLKEEHLLEAEKKLVELIR